MRGYVHMFLDNMPVVKVDKTDMFVTVSFSDPVNYEHLSISLPVGVLKGNVVFPEIVVPEPKPEEG